MELLIEREKTWLNHVEGKSFVHSDAPEFLKKPLCVLRSLTDYVAPGDSDLLIRDASDFEGSEHLDSYVNVFPGLVPALWSGRRSVLVRDPKTKVLYRIKGAALDPYSPEPMPGESNRINGGHKLYNVECEARMSSRFNSVLEGVGIEPVMIPKGMWKYPVLYRGQRPAASVFEVKGDTRLDELVEVLEQLAILKMTIRYDDNGKIVHEGKDTVNYGMFRYDSKRFMFDIGFIVGRLKRLIDRSGMIWGHDRDSTNAHWGNIVLYREGNKLKVNLVDLDIAEDRTVHSASDMRRLHREEYDAVAADMLSRESVSPRRIRGKPFAKDSDKIVRLFLPYCRNSLKRGFANGYRSTGRKYSNELDIGRLHDMYYMLRMDLDFTYNSEDELKWHRRFVEYWTCRMHEFKDYAKKMEEKGVSRKRVSVISAFVHLSNLESQGIKTKGLEIKLANDTRARNEFLRDAEEGRLPGKWV